MRPATRRNRRLSTRVRPEIGARSWGRAARLARVRRAVPRCHPTRFPRVTRLRSRSRRPQFCLRELAEWSSPSPLIHRTRPNPRAMTPFRRQPSRSSRWLIVGLAACRHPWRPRKTCRASQPKPTPPPLRWPKTTRAPARRRPPRVVRAKLAGRRRLPLLLTPGHPAKESRSRRRLLRREPRPTELSRRRTPKLLLRLSSIHAARRATKTARRRAATLRVSKIWQRHPPNAKRRWLRRARRHGVNPGRKKLPRAHPRRRCASLPFTRALKNRRKFLQNNR